MNSIAGFFQEHFSGKTIFLRSFSVYGSCRDPVPEYAAVIPKCIARRIKRASGHFFCDGKQTRDFVFVQNIVEVKINAMKRPGTGIVTTGSGQVPDLNTRVQTFRGMNSRITPRKSPGPGYSNASADIFVTWEALGAWFSLTEGMAETIRGFRPSAFQAVLRKKNINDSG